MENIQIIGHYPYLSAPIHGRNPLTPDIITERYNRIVDHALDKHLKPHEADRVRNDFFRSPWSEDALKHDIEKLNSKEHIVNKDAHYWKAINHVYQQIKPEVPLQPVHFADLKEYNWRLSTNCGAPLATSKKWQDYVKAKYAHQHTGTPFHKQDQRDLFVEAHKNTEPLKIYDVRMSKHNLYSELFFHARKNIHYAKLGRTETDSNHDFRYWNTAFARQHIVERKPGILAVPKVRLVFGAPFTLLTAELMFIWPLQTHLLLLGNKSPMLWGYETILGGWYRLQGDLSSHAKPGNSLIATLDWSGFDRDARHTVIRDIHTHIMRPCFDFSKGYHPTIRYTDSSKPNENDLPIDEKLENLWNWMTDSILSVPLLMPDGTMIRFTHSGIYSGYMQTQILDSLYDEVMIYTILSRLGFDITKVKLKVQGDDSIFVIICCYFLLVSSFLYLFSFYAAEYFGSKLSKEKSEIHETLEGAEVLKYRNHNGIPYRDELQLLAQLRHPERSTTQEALASRCVGIAYAACGQLPRVYLICEDIYKYLTEKKDIIPKQSELDFYFRYLEMHSGQYFNPSAEVFPSHFDTLKHLMDGHQPLANKQWPVDYFIGLPGRR